MEERQEVYRSIQLNDNIKTASLGVMDQLRLIFAKMSNDDEAELESESKLSVDKLSKISALSTFFNKAIEKMESMHQASVTLQLSPEFLPFLNDVTDDVKGLGRYYVFTVLTPKHRINKRNPIIMRVEKKQAEGGIYK